MIVYGDVLYSPHGMQRQRRRWAGAEGALSPDYNVRQGL